MAVHRRPPVKGPPLELLTFRADDWLPDVSPYWAWLMARFEWARTHPNDFSLGGDVLDMLRERGCVAAGVVGIRDFTVSIPGTETARLAGPKLRIRKKFTSRSSASAN